MALLLGIILGLAGSRTFVTPPSPPPAEDSASEEREWGSMLGSRSRSTDTGAEALATRMAEDSPEAVARWLESRPQSQRHYGVEDYVRERGHCRAHEILALAEALPPGRTKNFATQGGIGHLAHRDPHATMTWAETHLEGERLDLALGNVVSAWASTHPVEAADWVVSRENLHIPDRFLLPLVRPLVGQDPSRAWKLASQIRDPHQREEVVLEAIAVLAQKDPAAAKTAISELPIDNLALPAAHRAISETAAWHDHLVSILPDA